MKLRLDEYYYIILDDFDEIEFYMPEELKEKSLEYFNNHSYEEYKKYMEKLYSHINIINTKYNINYIDLEGMYINYTAIIKIDGKYYSFDYYDTSNWNFEDCVKSNEDLKEVHLVEKTIKVYE